MINIDKVLKIALYMSGFKKTCGFIIRKIIIMTERTRRAISALLFFSINLDILVIT